MFFNLKTLIYGAFLLPTLAIAQPLAITGSSSTSTLVRNGQSDTPSHPVGSEAFLKDIENSLCAKTAYETLQRLANDPRVKRAASLYALDHRVPLSEVSLRFNYRQTNIEGTPGTEHGPNKAYGSSTKIRIPIEKVVTIQLGGPGNRVFVEKLEESSDGTCQRSDLIRQEIQKQALRQTRKDSDEKSTLGVASEVAAQEMLLLLNAGFSQIADVDFLDDEIVEKIDERAAP